VSAKRSKPDEDHRPSASSEGRGPGRPPGGGDSRQAILDAAASVFLRDGLNASTRDIATEAGVTQAALYHYFPTKKDLMREAASGASHLFEPIGALARTEGEPEEVFRRMGEGYLQTFARGQVPRFMATMLSEGRKIPGFLPAMGGRLQKGIVGPVVAYVTALQEEGRVSPDVNAAMVGQMLFGTMFSYMMARDVIKAPWVQDLEPAEVAAQVARVLARGMTPQTDPELVDRERKPSDE
jgi:AcrR family transcriptional regulator